MKVPSWRESAVANWPAIIALAISVVFGAYATGIMPGENPNRYWGPATLIAWAMAGALYIVFVAIARAAIPRATALKKVLGFSKLVIDEPYPSSLVVDLATISEGAARPSTPSTLQVALAGSAADD
jgi:hypothetical protein